jgi:MOSC domain-containing protein YiiM
MKVISVNVSIPKTIEINGELVSTGIYKNPVPAAIWLGKLTLDGDDQADKKVHGGPHQAAYCYPLAHYAHWQERLAASDLPYGTFGENFTITGLDEHNTFIGDVLQIGEAVVQVTMPRIPCFKLAHKLGDAKIIKEFLQSGRSGFYLRVLTEGNVKAGDAITIISHDPQAISVHTALILQKLDLDLIKNSAPENILRSALSISSLAPLLKEEYSKRLALIT